MLPSTEHKFVLAAINHCFNNAKTRPDVFENFLSGRHSSRSVSDCMKAYF